MILKENKQKLIDLGKSVTDEWLQKEINHCLNKIKKNMEKFGDKFPSACGTEGVYRIKENDDWTNGFWTGLLWLSYEFSQDDIFLKQAEKNIESFKERLDAHFILDHHDIGFLYSLSVGAGYKLTNKKEYKKILIEAAEVLKVRFQPNGNFIQAWGEYGEPTEYRLIIDSLINLPLLLEVSLLTGDDSYKNIAKQHYKTLLSTVIRKDFTTYHTFYFDSFTGEPTHGATHQGNSDSSIWARGQSWAILGIPLIKSFNLDEYEQKDYEKIVDVFISQLPEDLVPYWDFDFTDRKPSAKDSSSLAITACGLLEANDIKFYPDAKRIAKGMIYQLGEHYSSEFYPNNEGLLIEGVYAYAEGKGISEPNLWGDYFYLEALMRLNNPNWKKYW